MGPLFVPFVWSFVFLNER